MLFILYLLIADALISIRILLFFSSSLVGPHRLVDGPLVHVAEFVHLVALHVARVDRLRGCIEDNRHLEQEQVVRGGRCASQLIGHAVEVEAVTKELSREATEDENVLTVFLHCTATLTLREHFVVDFDLGPFILVSLVISLNCVDIFASAVRDTAENVD